MNMRNVFFTQTEEKGVGVDCGVTESVHKMYVFFLSSSKVLHISKNLTMFRGAIQERYLNGGVKQYHVFFVCS